MTNSFSKSGRWIWRLLLLLSVAAAMQSAAALADVDRDGADRQQLAQSSPAAMARVEAAEAAAKEGRFAQAVDLIGRAREDAPTATYPPRSGCRIALAAKDRVAALKLCQIALLQSAGHVEDLRNRVVAAVSSDMEPAPTMSELVDAAILTRAGLDREPDSPWVQSARLEIGRRLGDRVAIDAGLEGMERHAPDAPVTKTAIETAFARAPLWVWSLRVLLLGVLLATVAHALFRRRQRPGLVPAAPAPSAPVTALLFALVVSVIARAAWGADATRVPGHALFLFNEHDPDSTVPSAEEQMKEPLQFGYYLQEGIDTALKAAKQGDHAHAAQYWAALAKAVPSRAYAFGKQCQELELAGDREGALTACEAACTRDGVTVGDYNRTTRLLIARPGELTADDRTKLKLIIEHLATEAKSSPEAADRVRCRLAVRDNDVAGLQACSDALEKVAPRDLQTISFQWALAISKHDQAGAHRLIEQAKSYGMTRAALERMEDATDHLGLRRKVKLGLVALVVALAVGTILLRRVKTARRLAA
jgi:hypothetical protein